MEKKTKTIAVYPGSFDPITSGHFDIIRRASGLYDELIVLIAQNASKTPLFTLEERRTMAEASCHSLGNVRVEYLPKRLLAEYAMELGASVIVKGLRAVSDFEYEFQMALLNRRLEPRVETLFFMTDAEHAYLSSSIVKEIGRLGGDISAMAPAEALPTIRTKFAEVSMTTVDADREKA